MEENILLPAVLAPDSRQKRIALIAALLVPIPFIAIIPFGQNELPRVDSYIPVVDTVMLVNDSIAATLLFAQFSVLRAPSLLALAGGFLLTAFLVIPHALTFPGAFAPEGLLGAGLQTSRGSTSSGSSGFRSRSSPMRCSSATTGPTRSRAAPCLFPLPRRSR